DSDCPADMVCYAQPGFFCDAHASAGAGGSDGGCGDGEMCAPTVTECHEEPGDPVCVPRHVPPCSADADCGAGFTCEEAIATSCSGMTAGAGGGSAGAGAGASGGEDATAPSCTEFPTGDFRCELQELACESDDDCPGALRCLESWGISCGAAGSGAAGGVATGGAGGPTGTAGMAAPPSDPGDRPVAMSPVSPCEMILVSKTCAPDDYFPQPGGGAGGQTGGPGGGAAGSGTTAPPTMNPDLPTSGSAGASGANGGDSDPPDNDEWLDRPHQRFGCAVAGDDATDALWSSLGLLGLVALVLRRRARTTI
ncbi:MAG TPA: hypothetical protein VK509_01425, partial [Polyangiales bacterium]|nr:hypothetical protein [Polyangiales bacterium]